MPPHLIKLLFKLRKRIIYQPLRYVRNVKGEKLSLFGILSNELSFETDFHEHRKSGYKLKWRDVKDSKNWEDLLQHEKLKLFFGHQTYQEISLMRFWLRDVIIKRWVQECVERFDAQDPQLLSYFDLWKKSPERETAAIRKYRDFFLEKGLNRYTYCQALVKEGLEVDHLFPWSKFPVNRFWNLYPTCSSCNSTKKDKIPSITTTLEKTISKHLMQCLKDNLHKDNMISKDLEELYSKRFQSKWSEQSIKQLIEEIIEFLRNISTDLQIRFPEQEFKVDL